MKVISLELWPVRLPCVLVVLADAARTSCLKGTDDYSWLRPPAQTRKGSASQELDKVATNFLGSKMKLIASLPCDFISMMLCDVVYL